MLLRSTISGFANRVYRSAGGIWLPDSDVFLPKHNNILLVRNGPQGRCLFGGHNIITDLGDIYYAQTGAEDTPTNAFNRLFLSTVAFSPSPVKGTDAGDLASTISGAESAEESTYPKANDLDADNTGKGVDVITHKFAYSAAAFNDTTIEGLTIAPTATTFGSGADPLLNAANLASFGKANTDTLTVYVNHNMNGV